MPTEGLRSKSWDEFAGSDGLPFDVVITVCDAAAGEACPVWPGRPATSHWGLPDPAAVEGSASVKVEAFEDAYRTLEPRILMFVDLPITDPGGPDPSRKLAEIGRS